MERGRRRGARIASSALVCGLLMGWAGCGGGKTAVIGLGNSGNRILGEGVIGEELAEALAEREGTPRVTDEILAEIYDAILTHARRGDPQAALIVLRVAERQRESDG